MKEPEPLSDFTNTSACPSLSGRPDHSAPRSALLSFLSSPLWVSHGCHSVLVLLTKVWRSGGLTVCGRWICLIRSRVSSPLQGGFPPAPLLTGLMNLHFPSTPDANPEVLTKRTTAPSFRGVGDALWDFTNESDVTFQPRLQPSSTWQAADVTRPSAPWTKSTESSGGGSIQISHF